jgi:hypothetical protein
MLPLRRLITCLIFQLLLLPAATPLLGQDSTEHKFKNCNKAYKLVGKTWDDDTALLASARDYLTHCSAELSPPARVRLLSHMGNALIHTKQFPEATPILEECVKLAGENGMDGDRATCWLNLGRSAAYQRQCDLAEVGVKNSLDVATLDNLSAGSHEIAKNWMGLLQKAKKTGALQLPPPIDGACCASEIKCLPR